MKLCWILSKDFSASIKMIKWFLSFASAILVSYIFLFSYVEVHLHSWDEAYLFMVNDLFDVLLNSVCHYLMEDFYINVH
jgi:hypothetical protein